MGWGGMQQYAITVLLHFKRNWSVGSKFWRGHMYMDALMHDKHIWIILIFLSSHRALYIDVLVQNSYMHYIKFIQHKQFTYSI